MQDDVKGTATPARLAFNENPEAMRAEVRQRITAATEHANRYPFDAEPRVMAAVAAHFGCPEQEVMLVRGIDECFDRIAGEFPAMRYVTAWPGFNGYRGRIDVLGLDRFEIGLDERLMLREDDLARVDANDVVVLADPANPTGLSVGEATLARLQERCGLLVVDETYVDYSMRRGEPLRHGEGRLVFRSFSKSYGLAGIRLGAVFGPAALIAAMKRKQWFCNVGILELCALEAALEHDHARQAHVRSVLSERTRVEQALREAGLRVTPSEANFLLVASEEPLAAIAHLDTRGVQVKNAGELGLHGHLRITIGSAWENDRMLAAMIEHSQVKRVIYDRCGT